MLIGRAVRSESMCVIVGPPLFASAKQWIVGRNRDVLEVLCERIRLSAASDDELAVRHAATINNSRIKENTSL